MQTSTAGVDFVKRFEELRLVAYKPIPSDPWTIGYGSTRGVREGMAITEEEAERRLRADLEEAEAAVRRWAGGRRQYEFDAMVSFAFNVGSEAFRTSTLVAKLSRGDVIGAAAEFPRWHRSAGVPLRGLLRRRIHEMRTFLGNPDWWPS